MKKTLAALMCAVCVWGSAGEQAWAAIDTNAVRSTTKVEQKVKLSYPYLVQGDTAANAKINAEISRQVMALSTEAAALGGGTVSYELKKCDDALISLTLLMAPKQGVEETVGMTFDRTNGEKRPLSYYYNSEELLNRAADGLKYLYDVDATKVKTPPDTYYVDEDNNIIGIYHAGAILDKSEGEIEINLSAADPVVTKAPEVKPPAYSGTGIKGTITGTEVRMRSAAGLDSDILGYFTKGEGVKVDKSDVVNGRKWLQVTRADGSTGWVAADFCSVEGDAAVPSVERQEVKKGRIVGTEVRMRSDANLNGDVLDYFKDGEEVTILDAATGSQLDWTKVRRANGDVGWVASSYCREIK